MTRLETLSKKNVDRSRTFATFYLPRLMFFFLNSGMLLEWHKMFVFFLFFFLTILGKIHNFGFRLKRDDGGLDTMEKHLKILTWKKPFFVHFKINSDRSY